MPWFLRPGEAHGTQKVRSVAGAPQTARKKMPATPVGMTEAEKRRAARPAAADGPYKCWKSVGNERGRRKAAPTLERDVFVGDFGAGGGAEIFGGGGFVPEVVATAGCGGASAGAGANGHAVAAAAEHAEIGGDNFKAGALLAFLILPLAGLDAAFDKD